MERACRELVFHFNKKSIQDPTVPMWVVKTRGETYYVEHVEASGVSWSTKETPDNPHTKGSLKFKNVHLVIDDDNVAHLEELTPSIASRIEAKEKGYNRYIIYDESDSIKKWLRESKIKHGPFKKVDGPCGEEYNIFEIRNTEHNTFFQMSKVDEDGDIRRLTENEYYYKIYDG